MTMPKPEDGFQQQPDPASRGGGAPSPDERLEPRPAILREHLIQALLDLEYLSLNQGRATINWLIIVGGIGVVAFAFLAGFSEPAEVFVVVGGGLFGIGLGSFLILGDHRRLNRRLRALQYVLLGIHLAWPDSPATSR